MGNLWVGAMVGHVPPNWYAFCKLSSIRPRMGETVGDVSLRENVRRRWSVDRMIVYFISPVTQYVRESPVVR